MWIAENFNYQTRRQHTDDQVSRIQILEDTDGDGVFDKKKTFTDKLTFTSGMACGFGGVFVGSPPHLTFIPDKDGDDGPDGPPQVLLDGWGINDRHETLNSSSGDRTVGCTDATAYSRTHEWVSLVR